MVGGGGSGQQMKSLPVKVEMEGKRVLTGNLIIAHIKSLNEALNDTKQFLEFSTPEGTLQFISKKTIVHIESLDEIKEAQKAAAQKAAQAQQEASKAARKEAAEEQQKPEEKEPEDYLHVKKVNNPFELLGVGADSYDVEIQHAYHEKAKMYHPDRFANTELPSEVLEYMMTKAQLINSAYAEVCRIKEEKAADKAEASGFSL